MSYGSASLGSASLGGAAASAGTLYSPTDVLDIGVYRRTLEYTGGAVFFQIESRMENESVAQLRLIRIYSHNDSSETPQLQTTVGGDASYTQSIVGAARFIVVDLEMLSPWSSSQIGITITGSEYFQ